MNEPKISGEPNTVGQILHGLLWFVFVYSFICGLIGAGSNNESKDGHNLYGATAAVCLTISIAGLAIVNRIRP